MKAIEDRGHAVAATKPLQIKRYAPNRLPDPALCVDCLIIVNDRADGVPRPRLAVSNGASWDHVAWLVDQQPAIRDTQPALPVANDTQPIEVPSIDVTAIIEQVRERVLAAMPALPSPQVSLPQSLVERLDAIDRELWLLHDAPQQAPAADVPAELVERLAALEQRLAEPVGLDDDVHGFARRFSPRHEPEPAGPSVSQHIANAAVLSRLDALERYVATEARAASEPLEPAPQPVADDGPPLRVVEAAHLARNGQTPAITLMTRLGTAMGTDWETAALTVIRRHDEATAAAVEAYAIEIETRGA